MFRRACLAALLVLLAAMLVGCGDSQAEKLIVGTWHWDHGPVFFVFHEDGTYAFAMEARRLESKPMDLGDYTFKGDVLTISSGAESVLCDPGAEAQFKLSFSDDDHSSWEPLASDCEADRDPEVGDTQTFTRW